MNGGHGEALITAFPVAPDYKASMVADFGGAEKVMGPIRARFNVGAALPAEATGTNILETIRD